MKTRKSSALSAVSLAALMFAVVDGAAYAQTAAPEPDAQASAPEPDAEATSDADAATEGEVVVTGTRLTTGFSTPTPLTTLNVEQLQATGATNVADALRDLPAFKGSPSTSQPTGGSPNGTGGQNLANLRGLGAQRNLILLDGRRVIPTNAAGSVDINMLPQGLIERVEVVTGGASSAYGSDAVSGVVNFVLDRDFEGFKGAFTAGQSTYGDADSYKLELSWGGSFLNDRLHVIASFEGYRENEIDFFDVGGRDWLETPAGLIPNAVANTSPRQLILYDVRHSNTSYGGLITSGPLRGIEFGPGGAVLQHDYGTYLSGVWQVGGNGIFPRQIQSPEQNRLTGFLRAEYKVNENLNVYGEALLGWTNNIYNSYPNYEFGQFGFTIFNDNAYLPDEVRTLMAANNITSFAMGRTMKDQPLQQIDPIQRLERYEIGAEQRIWGSWSLNAYLTHSISTQDTAVNNIPNLRNLYAAADAVVDPATGQIVCRSTLTGLDPGCVPMNLFGDGSVSAEATQFVLGSSIRSLELKEDVFEASLSGNLPEWLSLGAGPISTAFGYGYRRISSDQTSDAVSQSVTNFDGLRGAPAALNNRPGGYQTFNPVPLSGEYDVSELFLELGVPLLADAPLAEALDLNLAGRLADYSNSGLADSWKVGVTYRPIDDILFRLSFSHDVRAPNILELFNPRSTNASNVVYNGVTTPYTGFTTGNPDLAPEEAETLTGGVTVRPRFAPGLSFSIDPYQIKVEGAIAQLGAQAIVDQCAAGSAVACALIVPVGGGALQITNPSLNLNEIEVRGIDFEALYRTELFGGDFTMRVLANYIDEFTSQTPGAPIQPQLDVRNDRTPWAGSVQLNWERGPFTLFLQERYIGEAEYSQVFREGVDINDNSVPAIMYTDATVQYDFDRERYNTTAFFSISNLFNKDPPATPLASTFQQPTNAAVYDTRGRYFRVGLRFHY